MADDSRTVELSRSELRELAGYAVACARPALAIFERERPDDRRPRAAIDAALAFADGGERTKALRDSAWAAHRAAQEARDAGQAAASNAARAAGPAVGAAFLHPLPRAASDLPEFGPAESDRRGVIRHGVILRYRGRRFTSRPLSRSPCAYSSGPHCTNQIRSGTWSAVGELLSSTAGPRAA